MQLCQEIIQNAGTVPCKYPFPYRGKYNNRNQPAHHQEAPGYLAEPECLGKQKGQGKPYYKLKYNGHYRKIDRVPYGLSHHWHGQDFLVILKADKGLSSPEGFQRYFMKAHTQVVY